MLIHIIIALTVIAILGLTILNTKRIYKMSDILSELATVTIPALTSAISDNATETDEIVTELGTLISGIGDDTDAQTIKTAVEAAIAKLNTSTQKMKDALTNIPGATVPGTSGTLSGDQSAATL